MLGRATTFWRRSVTELLLISTLAAFPVATRAQSTPLTLSFRDTGIEEVYEMLSRQAWVNILLGPGVSGSVSLNLYEVELDQAIRAIADAAGFAVEDRDGTYFVLTREDAGKDSTNSNTQIRSFKVQYTDTEIVAELLTKHLSRYGKLTTVPARRQIVVEDLPPFLERLDAMLAEIDAPPKQILIEAKILEISLDADQTYGIDWTVPFFSGDAVGDIGVRGLNPGLAGLFLNIVTPQFDLFLSALSSQGRVRTLSTPTLLVLENQEAEVLIGDRKGFRVTTTINQITTETIEFLQSGVILNVTAAVDRAGKVLLKIHPEVSNGTVQDGIPSQTTTEVTTQLLADDGQRIFIGGLLRTTDTVSRVGLPVLSQIPVLGALFSQNEERTVNTETVVLITPYIVDELVARDFDRTASRIEHHAGELELKTDYLLGSLPQPLLAPVDAFINSMPTAQPRPEPER